MEVILMRKDGDTHGNRFQRWLCTESMQKDLLFHILLVVLPVFVGPLLLVAFDLTRGDSMTRQTISGLECDLRRRGYKVESDPVAGPAKKAG
eukprot:scaffold31161_cov56-Attheya_sp.AAC.6